MSTFQQQEEERNGEEDNNKARIKKETISQIYNLLTLSSAPAYPDKLLMISIPIIIALYMTAGYYLLLSPGSLYNALVSEDWAAFNKNIVRYLLLATTVLFIRVLRNLLRDVLSNRLRHRITGVLHARYFAEAHKMYYKLNSNAPRGEGSAARIDNPDERLVKDSREFAYELYNLLISDNGGIVESCFSITFYTYIVYVRTGAFGLCVGYAWSVAGFILSFVMINKTSPVVFKQERLEADLRYAHARIRKNSEEIAFLNGGQWEKRVVNVKLRDAVANRWMVIWKHVWLSGVQNGFSYYVSIIMYGSLAFAIYTGVGFDKSATAGDKAEWISQTGSVFLQLLYAFSMFVNLSTKVSEFVAIVERLYSLTEALHFNHGGPAGQDDVNERLMRDDDVDGDVDDEEHQGGKQHDEGRVIVEVGDGNGTEKNMYSSSSSLSSSSVSSILLDELTLAPNSETNTKQVGPVSLTLHPRALLNLRGATGIGKTTLLRFLKGLTCPAYSGQVAVPFGRSVRFIPQRAYVPPCRLPLRDLAAYPYGAVGAGVDDDRLKACLDSVGWTAGDMDTVLDGEMLSIGEKQLLMIANVLWKCPGFVLLDEGASGLDEDRQRLIFNALRAFGIGVLYVGRSTVVDDMDAQVVILQ